MLAPGIAPGHLVDADGLAALRRAVAIARDTEDIGSRDHDGLCRFLFSAEGGGNSESHVPIRGTRSRFVSVG